MTFLLAHTPFVSRTWVLSQAHLLFCTILSRKSGSGTLVDCARRCHGSLIFAVTCSYKRSVNTVHVTFTRRRHTVLLFIPICAKRPHMCVCVCACAEGMQCVKREIITWQLSRPLLLVWWRPTRKLTSHREDIMEKSGRPCWCPGNYCAGNCRDQYRSGEKHKMCFDFLCKFCSKKKDSHS
jgi:hypothetical protein